MKQLDYYILENYSKEILNEALLKIKDNKEAFNSTVVLVTSGNNLYLQILLPSTADHLDKEERLAFVQNWLKTNWSKMADMIHYESNNSMAGFVFKIDQVKLLKELSNLIK